MKEIRKAEDRARWIQENHEKITRVLSGSKASQDGRYPDWYDPPHDPESLVFEFISAAQEEEEVELLRAHVEDNQDGYWLIPPKSIGGLDPDDVDDTTAKDLQNVLALPECPKCISKVTIPPETPMRISTIKENFGKDGGWPQIELENRLGKDAYEIIHEFDEQSDRPGGE